MSDSEIIMLVSAIFTALAAVAATVTCLLHYFNSKPKIKVTMSKSPNHFFFFDYNQHYYAAFALNITNSTSVCGVVDDVALNYNKVTYSAETHLIDLTDITKDIYFPYANQKILLSDFRLKCPLKMDGYSIQYGFFIVPDLPLPNNTQAFTTDISFKIIGKRRTFKFKNITFNNIPKIV